ncbi:MAG TPA: P1 family peptidase [Syntrophorhabdaceae bacterium]|nr:P1 family peptidase [Syntrophorhabdaceae bacterium]
MLNAITDIQSLKVGHYTDRKGCTGCTVILCQQGAVCGIDIRGNAAGTRQIDALSTNHIVEQVHGILLAGGSAFGLDAAAGVARYLEERGVGFDVGVARIPIVPSAVIFDLGLGNPKSRPTPEMGYEACLKAGDIVEEGSVGAGTGATVGKLFELPRAMKGGLGTCSLAMPTGLKVAALVVVNAFGDIIDNVTGKIIVGVRKSEESLEFANTVSLLKEGVVKKQFGIVNTTLGVVATNARFDKREATKMAQMAHGGLIKTIHPVHTTFDGDLVFALATGEIEADVNNVGVLAEFVLAEAIKRAVKKADGFGLIPSFRDISKGWKTA